MKIKKQQMGNKIAHTIILATTLLLFPCTRFFAQDIQSIPDSNKIEKPKRQYSLKINKGDWWLGGGVGIAGSIAPIGQYVGISGTATIKGAYHVIDKLSVGAAFQGGLNLTDEKDKGIYTRGITFVAGPIVQYLIPVSNSLFLSPLIGVNVGPIRVKNMVSAAGAPAEYVKVRGTVWSEYAALGPYFVVIPEIASFGFHVLYNWTQESSDIYSGGNKVPGTRVKDKRVGPGMIAEFRIHF